MRFVKPQEYEPVKRNFGAALRSERKKHGLTMPQLAKLSGVSKSAISSIERGQRREISIYTALALLDALEVNYKDFIEKCKEERK